MLISEIFKPDNIIVNLKSSDKSELFEELVDKLVQAENLSNKGVILEGLWRREKKMSTGIAPNIAIPHTHVPNLEKTMGVLGISKTGIDYDSLDGNPVHLVMLLVGDDKDPGNHLKMLKRVAMLLNIPDFYSSILNASTPKELYDTLVSFE